MGGRKALRDVPSSGMFRDHWMFKYSVGNSGSDLLCGSKKEVSVILECGHIGLRTPSSLCVLKSPPKRCKDCIEEERSDLAALRDAGYKMCTACKMAVDEGDFQSDKSRADGLQSRCKNCRKGKISVRPESFYSTIREINRIRKAITELSRKTRVFQGGYKKHKRLLLISTGHSVCNACNKMKPCNDFYENKYTKCIRCVSMEYRDKVGRPVSTTVSLLSESRKRSVHSRLGLTSAEASGLLSGIRTEPDLDGWMNNENRYGVGGNYDLDNTWQIDHIYPVASYVRAVESGVCTKEEAYIHCEHWTNKRPMGSRRNMEKSDRYDGHRPLEPFPDPRFKRP
jgi:hypothetical protein